VAGTPTYLLHLAEVAQAEGLDVRQAGVRLLVGGGEAGFSVPVTRQRLLELWGAEGVVDCYGVSEALCVAVSCREWAGGVHEIEDAFHSYVVDPESGEPLGDAEAVGEHVVTSYVHFSQPIIKYRTHDLVRRNPHPDHGCGWTWGHWPGVVLGRTDFMVVIRGVNVYPTAVENLLGTVSGLSNHYELHVSRSEAMDRMLVRVEAADSSVDLRVTVADLEERLRESLGVRLQAEVVAPGALPRYELKTKRFYDHRSPEERPQATLGSGSPHRG
jgi:phenylacetate-CoA ligase